VFDRRILEAVPRTSFQDIKETLIPKLYRDGHLVDLFIADEISPRVLNAESYLSVNHWMIKRTVAASQANSLTMRAPGLVADDSARVADGATIIGPVVLGRGVCVESGATIVGPTCIGADSTVRAHAVVARSVVWSRCEIEERAIVDRSLLADDVRVEAEDTIANAVRTPHSEPSTVRSRAQHGTRRRPHAARQLVNTTAM
jgi:NDP-sugar pyrophosphorylase family protein